LAVTSKIHTVYNLAADMGGMGFIEKNKALCMMSVLINTNLLESSRLNGVDKYFFASSACVYNQSYQSDAENPGLKESDAYPADPEDGYGWEKLFSERMCRHFGEDFGLGIRIARFHNVYGPLGTFDGGREKAPAAVCRKVAEAVISDSNEIQIWGDGEQTRSFTYIDDTVLGIQKLMDSSYSAPINLGSSQMVSINQLVDIVEDIAGIKLNRKYIIDAPKGVRGRNSENTLIKEVLNWEPKISLEFGLEKTYKWIYDELSSGSKKSWH
jgi:nucleoside-diphosphate-sugar epimerase